MFSVSWQVSTSRKGVCCTRTSPFVWLIPGSPTPSLQWTVQNATQSPHKIPPKKSDSVCKSPVSNRHILVTAGEGQSGRAIIECLLQGADFVGKHAKVTALIFSDEDKDLKSMGANVLAYEEIRESLAKELKNAGVDAIMLMSPASALGAMEVIAGGLR